MLPSHHDRQRRVAARRDSYGLRPRLPRIFVPRPELWERLDAATRNPLTLLVGPMGSGKSLGVSGWLSDRGHREALWVQGGPSYDPDSLERALSGPGLVVIDDAHLLPPASIRLLDHRLNNAPQSMRVLLVSRWDLPITRLGPELLGHLTVLRGELLRLNEAESAILIAEHARTSSAEVARVVTERTQGWCGAVVLAARAIASARDPVVAAQRFHDQDTVVADAVASEVFASLKPRVRHMLLCVANEEVVTVATASHLTHEPQCGPMLADLETTGLLVTRLGDDPAEDVEEGTPVPAASATYRIHPLLAEVIRRRIAAGGVDVERAKATVLRAVRLDVARGERSDAFRRLMAINNPEAAADMLAREGHDLLMHGGGRAVQAFVRKHPGFVDGSPDVWFAVAMERWFADDIDGAMHWAQRLLDAEPRQGDRYAAEIACLRLFRARLGLEPTAAAISAAQRVADDPGLVPIRVLPRLLGELGLVRTWTGDLDAAEVNLAEAVRLSKAADLPTYAAVAMTHLAMNFYCQGKERECARLAHEALEVLVGVRGWHPRFVAPRAELALQLAGMADLPWPGGPSPIEPTAGPIHSADHTARFWSRMRDARLALAAGSVVTCESILQTAPRDIPPLPRHLRIAFVVEQAFVAALAGDERGLTALAAELDGLGAPDEQALLAGLHADLRGDRRAAVELFATAADGRPVAQPACRALALVCEAQLCEELGDRERSMEALRTAVTITEVRGNAVSFLGWTRHGSSVHRLLARLAASSSNSWLHDLASATEGRPNVTEVLGPWTPTVQERERVSNPVVSPVLSPRERDVLHELARGSTYADIAANLFVSENTVKSHVSSLYGKLSVGRRSEALAVARNLDLL